MRLAKVALFGVLALSMWFIWSSRDYVAAAYSTAPDNEQIRLSGVDLEIDKTPIEESPFAIRTAEDTRRKPIAVLFTEQEVEQEPIIEMTGGGATIQGSANGPSGPAFGGVVRLERHTIDGIGKIDTRIDANGGWGISELPGGRYRVRAWVPGRATMAHSEVFFIADDGVVSLGFDLQEVDPAPVLEFVHGGPMYNGLTGTIGIGVSQKVVDADGLILATPIAGAPISIQVSSEVSSTTGSVALTDEDGVARFTLRCNRTGTGNIVVRYGLIVESYSLPGCRAIPPPPTVPPTVPTTRAPANTQRATRPATAPATTVAPSTSARPTTRPTSTTARAATSQATVSPSSNNGSGQ